MKTVVIGGGILGAAIAWRLAEARGRSGAAHEVTVIDAGAGAGAATPASFGWINASFFLDPDHFRLRLAGLQAWRRVGDMPGLEWCGALYWEKSGPELAAFAETLSGFDYPVERQSAAQIRARVPALGPVPDDALFLPEEAAADPLLVTNALWDRAEAAGARRILGLAVTEIETRGGAVSGVAGPWGRLECDRIVVAAGCGAPDLLGPLDVDLPMLPRPGAMVVSRPVPRLLDTILVTPERELRQDRAGRILAPGAVSHQGDRSAALAEAPEALADTARDAVAALLPGVDADWVAVRVADRPVPADGLPVIGAVGPEGLHVAVMHSGITLAALVGEVMAAELEGGDNHAAALAPYRPDRFV